MASTENWAQVTASGNRYAVDAVSSVNQSLQQMRPSVMARADARSAPAVFAAEAGVRCMRPCCMKEWRA